MPMRCHAVVGFWILCGPNRKLFQKLYFISSERHVILRFRIDGWKYRQYCFVQYRRQTDLEDIANCYICIYIGVSNCVKCKFSTNFAIALCLSLSHIYSINLLVDSQRNKLLLVRCLMNLYCCAHLTCENKCSIIITI